MKTKIIAVLTAIFIRRRLAAILVAALAAPSVALAEEPETGLYAGAGAAYVVLGDEMCDPIQGVAVESCDDKAFGFKLLGGYRFSEFFGVEVGYVAADGFEAKARAALNSGRTANIKVDADYSSFYSAAVGRYSLKERLTVAGKVGIHWWKLEGTVSDIFPSGADVYNEETDETDFGLGLGAEYKVLDNFAVQADWDYHGGYDGTHHLGISAAAVF